MVGRSQGRLLGQRGRGHPRLPARPHRPGHLAGRARALHRRPRGSGLGGRGHPRPGAAGTGLRPRPGTRAGGRSGPRLVPGDLHTHTVHSDGRRTPAELAAAARAAGLDFIASTEHNTTSASLGWGAHAGPDLLVLDGQEVTTRDGHWLALGLGPGPVVEWRYRAGDGGLGRALAGVHERGGLAVAAHPFLPLPGGDWRFGYQGLDAVEVWNGPWTPDDEATLGAWQELLAGTGGRSLPAVAGSDAHDPGDQVGLPHNVALADGLDRRSILEALAAGRSWLAGSAGVDLRLEAAAGDRSAGIGERLAVPAGRRSRSGSRCGARPAGWPGCAAPAGRRWRPASAPATWRRWNGGPPPPPGLDPGRGPPGPGHRRLGRADARPHQPGLVRARRSLEHRSSIRGWSSCVAAGGGARRSLAARTARRGMRRRIHARCSSGRPRA